MYLQAFFSHAKGKALISSYDSDDRSKLNCCWSDASLPARLLSGYFSFFMRCVFLAPLAILLKLDFSLHLLLVFGGIIIPPLTDGALERY